MEIVLECPAEHILEARRFVVEQMEQPIPGLTVPVVAEAEVGYRWGEKHGLSADGTVRISEEVRSHHTEFIQLLEKGGVKIV